MEDSMRIWTEEERIKLRKKELKKLKVFFKDLPRDKANVVDGLIEHAAFQRVMLDELSQVIAKYGYIGEYQNGENQKGLKKSAAVETYDKTLNTYSKIVKQLADIIDKTNDSNIPGAEIMNFLSMK